MPLKTAACFEKMKPFLKTEGPAIVKKIGFVYHFEIAPSKGKAPETWTVDLKNGGGAIQDGKQGKADATFSLVD